ncbi:uracil-DNA glycosylase [Sporanaerobacter sp. PP17-6a]|jgi:DNA polymerase|uniref:uracil-DNA glycosylase n=1 Tax=Sporanaerobacter sp. PP17-6a TaxID=1891289 RepID=UPI00089FEED8|nr:uracil-DNA glycosylase [Sporanaerobacter sp. PP17-6a]MBE6082261.1 uracil-DNA glycosylase [Tissierellaceae bacterium]SCL95278.1 uracil-DNA glycosylase, family 4 [Sporanaerobacter sp. PP17-6a]
MYTLEELEYIVSKCHRCDLSQGRTNVVFGEGNKKARLMFIGEGPGYNEDQQGRPFVGKAGQLLDKMVEAIGLKREDVYIANVVKCRPPNNRNPYEEESVICIEYLRWQVKIINPDIIVCLGAIAARNIISPDFKITADRGKWIQRGSFYIMPTYHPAALLRDENKKKDSWEDFKKIRDKYKEVILTPRKDEVIEE